MSTSNPIYIYRGREMSASEYAAAIGQLLRPARRGAPTAMAGPAATAKTAEIAAAAERERISNILALPAAKANRRGAEGLAFGSNATVAEASLALSKAADRKAEAREAAKDSMRRVCGLPTATLRPGEIRGLQHVAKTGRPADRADARKRLQAAGINV